LGEPWDKLFGESAYSTLICNPNHEHLSNIFTPFLAGAGGVLYLFSFRVKKLSILAEDHPRGAAPIAAIFLHFPTPTPLGAPCQRWL